MPQEWRTEFYRLLALLFVAATIGFIFGFTLLAVLITLGLYISYFLYQLNRLSRWLKTVSNDPSSIPPESTGFWGTVFDGIYHLQRRERKASAELQKILSRAQKSVESIDIAIVLIDKDNNIEWWNKAAELLIGFRYPEDRGQTATNLFRNPELLDYFTAGDYQEPLTLTSPVNSEIFLEVQISLFGEREKLMIVRDVTQVRMLELMREDFVANVSHELRTPITVISGYLESLMENNHLLDDKWHKPLEQMHQHSKRVENIVRDLLLLSRLETKASNLQRTNINVIALLNEIRSDASHIFSEHIHSITVEGDAEISLNGDRSELYSAISNLVFNAAKYTPNGGKIQLTAAWDDNEVVISVSDNGIGIEPQHLPRLTERFYRVDTSRSAESGGTGLGLAIVKHILMRHRATLEITSKLGKGSCFSCHFPSDKVKLTQDNVSMN